MFKYIYIYIYIYKYIYIYTIVGWVTILEWPILRGGPWPDPTRHQIRQVSDCSGLYGGFMK